MRRPHVLAASRCAGRAVRSLSSRCLLASNSHGCRYEGDRVTRPVQHFHLLHYGFHGKNRHSNDSPDPTRLAVWRHPLAAEWPSVSRVVPVAVSPDGPLCRFGQSILRFVIPCR